MSTSAQPSPFVALAAWIAVLPLASCGASEVVRPENPTAAAARGSQSVYVIEARGQPLVVDWQPEQRGDLEVAMREGVAVVGFGEKGLRLLPDCHIDGKYGFIGVNTKEQVVRLLSSDEVRANLSADALGIIATMGGELGTSQALDIAIVMVGKRKTTWSSASKTDAVGKCEGATHFVRGATVGAFAMRSGAKGTARSVAEIFGVGASTASGSEKSVQNADGLLEACRKASPEAELPPPQCGALIRLELVALDEATTSPKAKESGDAKVAQADSADACSAGLVFADGKCTKAEAAAHHACKPDDRADCTAECDKGSGESCNTLAILQWQGEQATDRRQSARLFTRACELGLPEGCANLANAMRAGQGVPKDPAKAVELSIAACGDGVAAACSAAAKDLFFGEQVPVDQDRAVRLMMVGCRGGDQFACSDLGVAMLGGVGGLKHDDRQAADLFKRACDGGVTTGCTNYGYMVEFGKGVAKDQGLAASIYERACKAEPVECIWNGIMAQAGKGTTYDPARARAAFQKTCDMARTNPSGTIEAVSCVVLNEIFGAKIAVSEAGLRNGVQIWKDTCKAGTERDCTLLGVSALGLGELQLAREVIAEACKMGDAWACSLRGHPKLK